ncbi:hypothetical protein [Pandoraea pnomenusa]|nr:hypothetical protein [Pandoraea pnomenusa]
MAMSYFAFMTAFLPTPLPVDTLAPPVLQAMADVAKGVTFVSAMRLS